MSPLFLWPLPLAQEGINPLPFEEKIPQVEAHSGGLEKVEGTESASIPWPLPLAQEGINPLPFEEKIP